MSVKVELSRRQLLRSTAAAVGAGVAFGPAGLGRAFADDLSGTLTFLAADYSPRMTPFWQKAIADFEAKHPHAKVALEIVGWQQNHDTVAQRLAAGNLPDVVNTATMWIPEFVSSGGLQPIGEDMISPELRASFIPSILAKSAAYQGQIWGVSMVAHTRGMFWNKDIFKEAGLDPEAPPKTWAEFKSDILQIHSKTGKFGYGFDGKGVQAFRYFGIFLWNNGGDYFTADGHAAFNSPEGIEALQFLVDLVKSGAVLDPTGTNMEDVDAQFAGGRLGIIIDGAYTTAYLRDKAPNLAYGVTTAPIAKEGKPNVVVGVTDALIVSKNANHALVRAFFDEAYTLARRTQFDRDESFLPVLTAELDLPDFKKPPMNAFAATLADARWDPLHPQSGQMQELVKVAMQQAFTGTDPKKALDDAADQFNALVNEK
jgi:multiple sugar transport system substrate-binding protein